MNTNPYLTTSTRITSELVGGQMKMINQNSKEKYTHVTLT